MSFNPCYVGLWSVSPNTKKGLDQLVCFNPCYVGLWSVRAALFLPADHHELFQSLLCWIMVCKNRGEKTIAWNGKVSILVMLDYGL